MSSLLHFNPRAAISMPPPQPRPVRTDQVHLREAVFCDNCEMITVRAENLRCAHCASDAIISLAPILGHTGVLSGPKEAA